MTGLAQFHFLRPGWLLLLLPAAWSVWSLYRRSDPLSAWRSVIAPNLLQALLTQPPVQRSRLRPVSVLAAAMLVGILALAGPAWQREPTPFGEDQAALVIALKVTPGMLASDVQPSRLQRAVFKIRDLLELRGGTRNALVAYAGSAHLVMPLTSDAEIINTFASELHPDLMPVPGDVAGEAVAMANELLAQSGVAGSIVLVADAVDSTQLDALGEAGAAGGADVHLLAIAAGPEITPPADSPPAPALDEAAMRAAASAGGGKLYVVSADDSDVRQLAAGVQRSLANAPLQEGERWKDGGYYLLPVLAILLLLLFRRGGAAPLHLRPRTRP